MATKFISDSSCDMWEIENVDFTSVPLTISTDERDFVDTEDLDIPEMIEYMAAYKGRSYTACPSVDSWITSFGEADRIYIVTMTSALSGTYNSAVVAKKMYLQDHPDAEVHVFDTLSTGPEQRLLIEKLIELDASGISFEEVCQEAEKYLSSTRLFFALKQLHNLAQNGRVNKVLASAVGMMGISIFATASTEGTIESISKCRGDKKVITSLIKQLESAGYTGGKLRMTHIENPELAEKVEKAIREKYPQADVLVYKAHGLCAFYAEKGGIMIGCEC